MPTYKPYNKDKLTLTIKPMGIRRCWPFSLIPFFGGNKIRLCVKFKNRTDRDILLHLEHSLRRWDGSQLRDVLTHNEDMFANRGKSTTQKLEFDLYLPGEHLIYTNIRLAIHSIDNPILADFKVVHKDDVYPNILSSIMLLLLGAFFGWVFSFIRC
jgi:hypothetical protein